MLKVRKQQRKAAVGGSRLQQIKSLRQESGGQVDTQASLVEISTLPTIRHRHRQTRNWMKGGLKLCLLAAILTSLWACSSVQPALQQIDGPHMVQLGDEAIIRWRFSDVDSVRFENSGRGFAAIDSIRFRPQETRSYEIVGIGEDREVAASWAITVTRVPEPETVYVDQAEPLEKRLNLPPCSHFQESVFPSDYLTGFANAAAGIPNVRMKIMRVHNDRSGAPLAFDVVLMDQFGNYLPGIGADDLDWRIGFDCFASDVAYEVTPQVEEIVAPDHGLDIAVVADYAAYMQPHVPTLDLATQDMLCAVGQNDLFSLIRFDHRVEKLITSAPATTARAVYRAVELDDFGGLTALYRAAMEGMRSLEQSDKRHKCLILVTGGSEDASLVYTINDVAERARQQGVTVYSLAMGDNVDSYALRYLALYTGGRYYGIPGGDSGELRSALNEIVNSYRTFYRLTPRAGEVPIQSLSVCRDGIQADVQFTRANLQPRNELRRTMLPMKNYDPRHQILMVFEHASARPNMQFGSQLDLLAQTLRDNPSKNIEVIGHASLSGSDASNLQIARARAAGIRRALQERGVDASRIRMSGAGAATPMYYFESEDWQAEKNRRVEVRWLDASLAPFEIAAQTVDTEQEAIIATDEWQRRGVNAYYEMRLQRGVPRFRVRLWGYKSEDSAKIARRELQTKYGVRLTVL